METKVKWQTAGGSVIGRGHAGSEGILGGRNNGDSMVCHHGKNVLVLCVLDACSGSRHSEFGALLGAAHVPLAIEQAAEELLGQHVRPGDLNKEVGCRLAARLEASLLSCMARTADDAVARKGRSAEEWRSFVSEHLLFSLGAAVISDEWVCWLALGDPVMVIDGDIFVFQAEKESEPQYLGYRLLDTSANPEDSWIKPFTLPSDRVRVAGVASDGILPLIAAQGRRFPRGNDRVPPVSSLWADAAVSSDPNRIQRLLNRANNENNFVCFDPRTRRFHQYTRQGLLPDDTSLVVAMKVA